MHHFCQRIVRSIIDLFFFRDQLVAGRDGNINPDPILVSLFVGVVRLLNSNIAPADVITEFIQPRRFLQYHLFDSQGFLQAAISDVYWQLHSASILMRSSRQRQALSCDSAVAHFSPRLAATSENGKLTSPDRKSTRLNSSHVSIS